MSAVPDNPLSEREKRIIEANAELQGEECPDPDCDLTVKVVDLTDDDTLYVSHEEDRVGMASRSPRGETDGCRISPEADPTQ